MMRCWWWEWWWWWRLGIVRKEKRTTTATTDKLVQIRVKSAVNNAKIRLYICMHRIKRFIARVHCKHLLQWRVFRAYTLTRGCGGGESWRTTDERHVISNEFFDIGEKIRSRCEKRREFFPLPSVAYAVSWLLNTAIVETCVFPRLSVNGCRSNDYGHDNKAWVCLFILLLIINLIRHNWTLSNL